MRLRWLLALVWIGITPVGAEVSCRVSEHAIVLGTGDRTYTLSDDGHIQPLGIYVNIAGTDAGGKGIWLVPKKLGEMKVLTDTDKVKAVRATWDLSEGSPRYEMELELEVRLGFPTLFVKSRVRRLSEGSGSSYYYWGFTTAVTHYVSPGAVARDFPNDWYVLPRYRWVHIGQRKSGEGFGVITEGKVGRAPDSSGDVAKGEVGGFPYLICNPRTTNLFQGESHDVAFAVFTAKDPKEVEAVYRAVGKLEPEKITFDFQTFARKFFAVAQKPKATRTRESECTLATKDGLALALSGDGSIADVRVGKTSLTPKTPTLSGLLLRDFAAKSQPVPVGGTVKAGKEVREGLHPKAEPSRRGLNPQTMVRVGMQSLANQATQSAKCMNVTVNATYTAKPDRIDVHCDLKDLTGKDRAVTLYFALPVAAAAKWQWQDDLEHCRPGGGSRPIGEDEDEFISPAADSAAGANGINSLYPFATLGNDRSAIAFGIPLDQPRFCRMVYNSATKQFFIAFDLALVPEVKRWQSTASVDFSIFTHEPTWGFRSCAKKYYTMFPQFFIKRVKRDGGWVCWGNCADVPNVDELGFAYHWGLSGGDAAKWDNEHGIGVFPYIEATNMHQTMEEFKSATSEDVVNRLKWIADPNRKEPLPQWKYDHPYSSCLGDRDAALRKSAQAYLNSLIYDERGNIYGGASKTEFDLLIAKYVPCNANPALPDGVGAFFLDFWMPRAWPEYELKGGKVDGIGQDNYHVVDAGLSRRREQFPYESLPLCFETKTARPVIIKNFTTYEFTAEYLRRYPDKMVIANTCSAQFPFTYRLLDIHGYEWGIESLAPFARVLAYHKPVCSLPVQPHHKDDKWIKWHLRYGVFPGGYGNGQTLLNRDAMKQYVPILKELSQAGWEPV
ncbi:MAG: hypothetical protein HY318_06330, partial [Armatimonadetes bacterium]|nr:hypothetical protein [Armatimonadota bacterium]